MGVLNVTSANQAILTLGTTAALAVPGVTNGMVIPVMQDVTVGTSPGSVRYSTLDLTSSRAFTTVNENTLSTNMLVDEDTFFGPSSAGGNNVVADKGLFQTSVEKTEIFFSVAFEGATSGDHYVKGSGFISGLAPAASMDAAVWITPMEIIVNGDLTKATI